MKIISFDNIKSLNIPVTEYYAWVVDSIKNKNAAFLPPKISLKPADGVFCNVMPSMVFNNDSLYGGVKTVTRYPARVPSLESKILLYNMDSGETLAMMDGNWITAARTGCVAAHSIMTFAKKDFRTIGIIGLGNVSRSTLEVLLSLMPEKDFHIKLHRHNKTEFLFAERFSSYRNIKFDFFDDYYSVIKGSDVVISGVTYAQNNFCDDSAFDEGVLVVPIHTLGFTNCDLFFDKVFADDTGHVCHFRYFDRFKKYAEVSDVINGKASGRENEKERILVYNIGISLHDICFASHIYEKIRNDKNVAEIDFSGPTDKYWV